MENEKKEVLKDKKEVVATDATATATDATATATATDATATDFDGDIYGGFFDVDVEDMKSSDIVDGGSQSDPNIYNPSLSNEKVVNDEYVATIRYIPNTMPVLDENGKPKGKPLQVVSKYQHWLQHPTITDGVMPVDDNTSFNKNNIVTLAFFELYRSKNKSDKDLAQKFFGRKIAHFQLVQIIKDNQQPELENQIKVFRYANQVDKILASALLEDPEKEIFSKKYSDPICGYKFILTVNKKEVDNKEKTAKFMMTNYDDSRFADRESLLQFPKEVADDWNKTPEGKLSMVKYVRENSPNLYDYVCKPWDKETEDMVIESVKHTINDPALFDKIFKKAYGRSYFSKGEEIESKSRQQSEEIEEQSTEEHVATDVEDVDLN